MEPKREQMTQAESSRSNSLETSDSDELEIHAVVESALRKSMAEAHIDIFQAVSDINRLRILALIASNPDDYPCTGLEEYLALSKSTISYHVKILSRAGLIDVRKDGRNYRYTLRRQIVDYFLPGFEQKLLDNSIPLD